VLWDMLFEPLLPVLKIHRAWQRSAASAFSNTLFFNELLTEPKGGESISEQESWDWKTMVQIKQSLADSLSLSTDLNRSQKRIFAYWWFYSLEIIRQAESQLNTGLTAPVFLSRMDRLTIRYQSLFGRMTFK